MRGTSPGAPAPQPSSGSTRAESAPGAAAAARRSSFLLISASLRSFASWAGRVPRRGELALGGVLRWAFAAFGWASAALAWALLIGGGLAVLSWTAEPGAGDPAHASAARTADGEPSESVWAGPPPWLDLECAVIEADKKDDPDPGLVGALEQQSELLLAWRDVSCPRRSEAEAISARLFVVSGLARGPPTIA